MLFNSLITRSPYSSTPTCYHMYVPVLKKGYFSRLKIKSHNDWKWPEVGINIGLHVSDIRYPILSFSLRYKIIPTSMFIWHRISDRLIRYKFSQHQITAIDTYKNTQLCQILVIGYRYKVSPISKIIPNSLPCSPISDYSDSGLSPISEWRG